MRINKHRTLSTVKEPPVEAPMSAEDASKKARFLFRKLKPGQSVLYKNQDNDRFFRLKIVNITQNQVTLQHPSYGMVLVPIINFYPNSTGKTRWIIKNPENIESSKELSTILSSLDLRILTDENSTKLVHKLYKEFVSERNFTKFPEFLTGFDNLLYELRGGNPLHSEEIEEINNNIDTDNDGNIDDNDDDMGTEENMNNNDDENNYDELQELYDDSYENISKIIDYSNYKNTEIALIQNKLSTYLQVISFDENELKKQTRHPVIINIKKYAIEQGFTPYYSLPPSDDEKTYLLSMTKKHKDISANFNIYYDNILDNYVLERQFSRNKAKRRNMSMIKPIIHVYQSPQELWSKGIRLINRLK